jgi:hypothetical protein
MAMVFFREPWYLRRNKHLFSCEVPEFQISESEFQFSDSPDIGIQKIFSDRNLWNQKRNRNSAYNGGPRNWNQKSEFPTKVAIAIALFVTIAVHLPTILVAIAIALPPLPSLFPATLTAITIVLAALPLALFVARQPHCHHQCSCCCHYSCRRHCHRPRCRHLPATLVTIALVAVACPSPLTLVPLLSPPSPLPSLLPAILITVAIVLFVAITVACLPPLLP